MIKMSNINDDDEAYQHPHYFTCPAASIVQHRSLKVHEATAFGCLISHTFNYSYRCFDDFDINCDNYNEAGSNDDDDDDNNN